MNDEPFPFVMYKYLPRPYAHSMLTSGSVRIGTLFEFREAEKYLAERSDDAEGKLVLHPEAGPRVYNATSELPPVFRDMSIHVGPGGFAVDGPAAVSIESGGTNMLVYCVSEGMNNPANEWGESCVRITDPARFFRALNAAVRDEMQRRGCAVSNINVRRCAYIDRAHGWHQDLPPTWSLKPVRFSHQREIRAAWSPSSTDGLDALVVTAEEIRAFVEDVGGA